MQVIKVKTFLETCENYMHPLNLLTNVISFLTESETMGGVEKDKVRKNSEQKGKHDPFKSQHRVLRLPLMYYNSL